MTAPQTLKASHLLVAYMEATGKGPMAIAAALNKGYPWVYNARKHESYPELLRKAQEEVASRIIDNTLSAKFDEESENSFNTIVAIRDTDQELGSTRIKAAVEILDRAPNAPKKRTETVSEHHTIIQVPVQQLGYMREAMVDCEEGEIVELLDNMTQPGEEKPAEKDPFGVEEVE